ncbi:spore cortex biosynthesis protein YabQ [Heliomicrobium undosum]|uniref:spore cortex biosynthesis protein YabQ n=1 Tax=Heliomicrobium undosum TaxID=121734 RepID=UPI00136A2291|nr:spore cortex biosynthesis protein YabQ [Heliomicrobium undosum]
MTVTPLAQQVYGFVLSAVGGLVLGTAFDLYRTIVGVGRRRWWVAVADVLMWMIGAGLFFLLLLWGHWGEVRLYLFLGLACGLGLYYRFMTEEVRAFWEGMLELILHLLQTLGYLVTFPFIFLYRAGRRALRWIYLTGGQGMRWAHRRLWTPARKAVGRLRARVDRLTGRSRRFLGQKSAGARRWLGQRTGGIRHRLAGRLRALLRRPPGPPPAA